MLLCPGFLSRHTLKPPCMLHWHIEEAFSVCTSSTIHPYPHAASRHLAPCLPPYRNLAHPGSSCSGASNARAPETRPQPCSHTRRQWPLCVCVFVHRVCVCHFYTSPGRPIYKAHERKLNKKKLSNTVILVDSDSSLEAACVGWCFVCCLNFKWSWVRVRFPPALWY